MSRTHKLVITGLLINKSQRGALIARHSVRRHQFNHKWYVCRLISPLLPARYPLPYAGISITPGLLSHISTIKDKTSDSVKEPDPEATSVLSIGIGLPTVPKKLVAHIQAREYIDMAELLPDRLGISTGLVNS